MVLCFDQTAKTGTFGTNLKIQGGLADRGRNDVFCCLGYGQQTLKKLACNGTPTPSYSLPNMAQKRFFEFSDAHKSCPDRFETLCSCTLLAWPYVLPNT